jgi:transposase InsO family protein
VGRKVIGIKKCLILLVGPGVVPQHSNFKNLNCQTALSATTDAKGILPRCKTGTVITPSRMPFVRVYFRETQELVFDAHDKAFRFYGGVCRRGIYDNMKTAVEAIFVDKARQYNRRFLQMCSHHLIEPCHGKSSGPLS